MHRKSYKIFIISIILICLIPLEAIAGTPIDIVQASTDKLLSIVSDHSLQTPAMKEKREQMIIEAVDKVFSWEEFSKRALAKNWNKRTPEEKKDFVLFVRQLIAETYMEKTYQYSGESIVYKGEKIEGDRGSVLSEFRRSNGTQIPVEYRVMKKGGTWLVYDLYIEGVSLVGNYRNQFNDIIAGSSYEDLVKRLKEKLVKKEQ